MTDLVDIQSRSILKLIHLTDWAAGLASRAGLFRRRQRSASGQDPNIAGYLHSLGKDEISGWQHIGEMSSLGNVTIDYLGTAPQGHSFVREFRVPEGTHAILKRSTRRGGMESLRQQCTNLRALQAEQIASRCGFQIPVIMAFRDEPCQVWSVESCINGRDGRVVLRDESLRREVLAAAASAVMVLQTDRLQFRDADEKWVADWIDGSIAVLSNTVRTIMTGAGRRRALDVLRTNLSTAFRGRPMSTSWYHGDFCPGNLLYNSPSVGRGDEEAGGTKVVGIIDWDRSGREAPLGFDVCQLAITTRRALTGRQLGEIIVDLLQAGRWSDDELKWMFRLDALSGPMGAWIREPAEMRAMVTLVWLRQIRANIEKSDGYASNRLWSVANVEWVLRNSIRF